MTPEETELQIRWMGKVRYRDALAVQQAINKYERGDYLLLLEHHPVYTMGIRASLENLKIDPDNLYCIKMALKFGYHLYITKFKSL